jgi:hypothetical protein
MVRVLASENSAKKICIFKAEISSRMSVGLRDRGYIYSSRAPVSSEQLRDLAISHCTVGRKSRRRRFSGRTLCQLAPPKDDYLHEFSEQS